jgi:DNA-3-methyladenine glycosylase II
VASGRPIRTYVVPPVLSSFPAERDQLEYSSRSLVFPSDGTRLFRAWGPVDHPFVVSVEEGRGRWNVWAWGATPPQARAAVRQLFSFSHSLEGFYRQVRREPVLRGTERMFRGLRVPRDATVYEALLHSIIGQQVSVRAAHQIKRRLFEATDAVLEVDGHEVPRVPSPVELLRLGAEGLRKVGLSRAKSRALLGIAEGERAGRLDGELLAALAPEKAVERLAHERGVGPWTAENALVRGVGRTDIFVAGDLGIRVALDRFGVVPRDRPEQVARTWAKANYPGWGSYATLYLWRKLVTGG